MTKCYDSLTHRAGPDKVCAIKGGLRGSLASQLGLSLRFEGTKNADAWYGPVQIIYIRLQCIAWPYKGAGLPREHSTRDCMSPSMYTTLPDDRRLIHRRQKFLCVPCLSAIVGFERHQMGPGRHRSPV